MKESGETKGEEIEPRPKSFPCEEQMSAAVVEGHPTGEEVGPILRIHPKRGASEIQLCHPTKSRRPPFPPSLAKKEQTYHHVVLMQK